MIGQTFDDKNDLDGELARSFDVPHDRSTKYNYEKYHTLNEMKSLLDIVGDLELVTVGSIGKSYENRDIWVVDIGHSYNPKDRVII